MRALFKVLLIALCFPVMVVLTSLVWLTHIDAARRAMVKATFVIVTRIFNIRVKVNGALSDARPLVLISNHSSYLDILVLGCRLPIAYTPKKEIKSWPIIGYCCRLAGCVFVERSSRAIESTRQQIEAALQAGRIMCIFAEGTTNNGSKLKPFKSSLFSLAEGNDVQLQPMVIRYTARDSKPLDDSSRAEIAWFGDMALLPHVWQVLNFKRIDAEITLLPLIDKQSADARKTLCTKCEQAITSVFYQEKLAQ